MIHDRRQGLVETRKDMSMLTEESVGRQGRDMIVGRARFLSWGSTIIWEHLIRNGTRRPFMVSTFFESLCGVIVA